MPRELFGDVAHPHAGLGSRKWYTLPLSLILHAVALTAVVIAPLMAMGVLPVPNHALPEFVQTAPVTPREVPPAPRALPAVASSLAANPNAAPLSAPVGVRAESGVIDTERATTTVEGVVPGVLEGAGHDALVEAPPPAPAPARPVRLHSGVRPPTKVRDVRPVYPTIALQARVEGVVILEAVIGTDGVVTEARVLRSIPLLDQAALDAVRQWVFTPTLLNGAPVPVVMTVTVSFTLR